jgi:hypothetical protein
LTINGALTLASGDGNELTTRTLVIGAAGSLDVRDNAVVIDHLFGNMLGSWSNGSYTSVLGMIDAGKIISGTNSGAMVVGAVDAASAVNFNGAATATWQGQTVDATTVCIRATYNGDANLNGAIDSDDFFAIDSHYGQGASSMNWGFGDFDLNGRRDADDYFIINAAHARSYTPLPAMIVDSAPAPAPARSAEIEPSGVVVELPSTSLFSTQTKVLEEIEDDVLTAL